MSSSAPTATKTGMRRMLDYKLLLGEGRLYSITVNNQEGYLVMAHVHQSLYLRCMNEISITRALRRMMVGHDMWITQEGLPKKRPCCDCGHAVGMQM